MFCAGGDFMLHMESHPHNGSEIFFLVGLVLFLIAHLYFLSALSQRSADLQTLQPANSKFIFLLFGGALAFILNLIVPNVADPVLKGGVVIYALVISKMCMAAFTLSGQESGLRSKINSEIFSKMTDQALQQPEGLYLLHQCMVLNGGKKGVWFRDYTAASLVFMVSDTILAVDKFVEKGEFNRHWQVLATYFLSLLMFTWAAFEELPCTSCL